jgi:glycosyltransferase involved in cell wall biosynthesis
LFTRAKEITRHKLPVYYLPPSVDLSLFSVPESKRSSNLRIFYGGSYGEKDGCLNLLRAFNILASKYTAVELILTGKPAKAGMSNVLKAIQTSSFQERIKFLGYLNDEEYYKLICESDILCMTRTNSDYANAGFPFKLGEMLATGKPVIATNVGDVSKFIIDRKNAVLIPPDSVQEIVSAVEYLLASPDKAAEIGRQGKATVAEHFDSFKVSQSLLAHLTDMIK